MERLYSDFDGTITHCSKVVEANFAKLLLKNGKHYCIETCHEKNCIYKNE